MVRLEELMVLAVLVDLLSIYVLLQLEVQVL
jgi:hypothetical protein